MTTTLYTDNIDALDIKQIKSSCAYDANSFADLVGPSEEMSGCIQTKFCPKCHVPAAQLRRAKNGVQLIRDGKVILTLGGNVTISAKGKERSGFVIKCPNGHKVIIDETG